MVVKAEFLQRVLAKGPLPAVQIEPCAEKPNTREPILFAGIGSRYHLDASNSLDEKHLPYIRKKAFAAIRRLGREFVVVYARCE